MIWKIDLAWIAKEMCLLPCHTFCECAVGPMKISVAPGFIGKVKKMLLIEPHPRLAAEAEVALRQSVLQVAIGFEPGVDYLIDNNGSSALRHTWCPTNPPKHAKEYPVTVVTFDSIDDGRIDILALDCEGQEWAVLSRMKSVPFLITVEIWNRNPYRDEILCWLEQHGYILRFSTGPETETQLYSLG